MKPQRVVQSPNAGEGVEPTTSREAFANFVCKNARGAEEESGLLFVRQPASEASLVFILLGGNEGDVAATFTVARTALEQRVGRIIKASSLHRTAPWGEFEPANADAVDITNATTSATNTASLSVPDFLNQILVIETTLSPMELLNATQAIEHELGRRRAPSEHHSGERRRQTPICTSKTNYTLHSSLSTLYHSRPIDIDILFYGNEVVSTSRLTIPHPLIARREFVLRPLAEVAPLLKHPITGLTAQDMLNELGV